MPDLETISDDLPALEGGHVNGTDRESRLVLRRWLRGGLIYSERERDGHQWHGVQLLGPGATSRVGLWVETDETLTISDVSFPCQMVALIIPKSDLQ